MIVEYLDEFLDEIKKEESHIFIDHQYTELKPAEYTEADDEKSQIVENDEESLSNNDLESNSKQTKKQYHKFHQLTGNLGKNI